MAEVSDIALAPIGSVRGETVREENDEEVFHLVARAPVESFRLRRSEIDCADLARTFDDGRCR